MKQYFMLTLGKQRRSPFIDAQEPPVDMKTYVIDCWPTEFLERFPDRHIVMMVIQITESDYGKLSALYGVKP